MAKILATSTSSGIEISNKTIVGGTLPEQSKTLTLGASTPSTVTPDSGYTLSSVPVSLDTSLIKADNIASGVQMLGITGTHSGGIIPSGNKDVTATTSTQTGIDITSYATLSVNPTPSESKTVTPNAAGQTVSPSSGKYLSSVVINGDSDLVASNVKNGVEIFGVTGTYAPSTQIKAATYTANGSYTISKDSGYDGMTSVNVTVAIPVYDGSVS